MIYSKLEVWQQKLLDMGKRNRLLNFKETKRSTLKITYPEADSLYKTLVSGKKLTISESPVSIPLESVVSQNGAAPLNPPGPYARQYVDTSALMAESETSLELTKTLYHLRMKAKTAVEETGANILYLAFGFMEWTDLQKVPLKSPLVMLPLELRRETLLSPYTISMYADDVVINPTLCYKLEADYGIKIEADIDDEEFTISGLLARVTAMLAGKSKLKLKVTSEVWIGLFSFLKINMYLDLKNNAQQIMENPIIQAICGDSSALAAVPPDITSPADLDKIVQPADTYQVVDADSSQQLAIMAAKSGVSFVLQGPPGTGKSQTITNIIAECMAAGKKVLFVSEKMAALEVVYNNLRKAGLSEFCLQLHSHKANKYQVIKELSDTLWKKAVPEADAAAAAYDPEELEKLKDILNRYVFLLHENVRPLNKSLFRIHSELENLKGYPDSDHKFEDIENLSEARLNEYEKSILHYISELNTAGIDYKANCFYGFVKTGITFEMRKEISVHFKSLAAVLDDAVRFRDEALMKLAGRAGETEGGRAGETGDGSTDDTGSRIEVPEGCSAGHHTTVNGLKKLSSIMSLISSAPEFPESFKAELLYDPSAGEMLRILNEAADKFRQAKKLEDSLLEIYSKEILMLEPDQMLKRFKGEYSTPLRFLNSGYRKDRITLKGMASDIRYKFSYIKAAGHLATAGNARELMAKAHVLAAPVSEWYGMEIGAELAETLIKALRWLVEVTGAIGGTGGGSGIASVKGIILKEVNNENNVLIRAALSGHGGNGKARAQYKASLKDTASHINNTLSRIENELYFVSPLFDKTEYDLNESDIAGMRSKFREASSTEAMGRLPDWIDFIKAANICKAAGLSGFISEMQGRKIPPEQWAGACRKRLYYLWLDKMYSDNELFTDFRRETFEAMVDDFGEKDRMQFDAAKAKIRLKLSSLRPDAGSFASKGSEVHTLLKEAEKRRRGFPVKTLFEEIPLLLMTLKPCLLMSPLSVSLFLDPALYEFDTVIFDEASQVCPENAIGAIYRAKQLIVVGDREQLPPTDFFKATNSDNRDEYDREDELQDSVDSTEMFESILDECGGILNRFMLLWHYRSRHEQLIAFSNSMIYGNLITFPSPAGRGKDRGVEFIHVPNGIYDRSETRTNKIEAEIVAGLVFAHFDEYPGRSVGVVAFSEAQQMAIDSELVEKRKNDMRYEKYFSNGGGNEPFFVKNLENVQGDERDTIIFSVGYGKDKSGKMPMSFGPLNREGGYRRLNVAITRAKINVKLVSSILPADIDLGKTDAQGVVMLRKYMEFAVSGTLPDTDIKSSSSIGKGSASVSGKSGGKNDSSSNFEKQILDFICENGFDADLRVGFSEYKIDIAVKDPDDANKYFIAVECDGSVYNSARTARERDRLRTEVLRSRGWQTYRIWSTAWIKNNASEKDLLLKTLNEALESYRKSNTPAAGAASDTDMSAIKPRTEATGTMRTVTEAMDASVTVTEAMDAETTADDEVPVERPAAKSEAETDDAETAALTGRPPVPKADNKLKTRTIGYSDIENIAAGEIVTHMKNIISQSVAIDKVSLYKSAARSLGLSRGSIKVTEKLDKAFERLILDGDIELRSGSISLRQKHGSNQ